MDIRARVNTLTADRRRVLTGAAAGGALLLAWWVWPRRWPDPLQLADGESGFGGWLKIGADGVVTLAVPQLEMGQGITTVLAQVAATELGADWRQMAVEMAPPAELYANLPLAARWAPLWSDSPGRQAEAQDSDVARFAHQNAFAATADGTGLEAFEDTLRAVAAQARAMLTAAAADRWGVAPESCEVREGVIRSGNRRLGFGALAAQAATLDAPEPPPLRPLPAAERAFPGDADPSASRPRLDLPAKVDGSFIFAADVRVPGMVHAAIRHAPYGNYELVRFDEGAAAATPGLIQVVRSKRWLAAVAQSWWNAEQALKAMRPIFRGPHGVDSAGFSKILADAIAQDGKTIFARGDADDALAKPDHHARYAIMPAAHGAIETASAAAHFADGKLTLWIASQAPERARRAAAKAIGLGVRDVALIPVGAGGSFDARLEVRHAIEAAQLAKALGRPVQLTWSRSGEMQAVPPRAPVMAELSAAFLPGSGGMPAAWRARLAAPATAREFGARLFENRTEGAALAFAEGKSDPLACEGAVPPYAIANVTVEHCPAAIGLPSGRLRGNAPAYTSFFTECFIDELAQKAGRDPMLFRISLLGQDARLALVLREAARLGGWDGGRRGSGQGLALTQFGTGARRGLIACVADASLAEGRVTVRRLSAAVDIGRIVNVDIARQQIEGGLIFGMAQAMGGALSFTGGKPDQRSLRELGLPALAQCPAIAIDFIASDAPPFDPGELGVAVAPPAIANALHAATGQRFRTLPLLTESL